MAPQVPILGRSAKIKEEDNKIAETENHRKWITRSMPREACSFPHRQREQVPSSSSVSLSMPHMCPVR